ncbi:MAG: SRPBCC family protein [Pseudomonadota bacterium]
MSNDVKFVGGDAIVITRVLRGPVERVWDYLVKDELRRKWFCAGDVSEEVGGRIEFDFDHSRFCPSPPPPEYEGSEPVSFQGEVLSYRPPEELSFTWPEAEAGPGTKVTITLFAKGDDVELSLKHERLDNVDYKIGAAAGWHAHLDVLDDILDTRDVRDFWENEQALEAHYREVFRAPKVT